MLIKTEIFESLDVFAAESTRHGGVSPSPYASLNLGLNTDDEPANIEENRRRYLTQLGLSAETLASAHQVHGKEVLLVTEPVYENGYDAIITREPGLAVGVTIADCCPVLIYDAKNKAVAAIHAGWRGTVARVVLTALQRMQLEFRTHPNDCYAYVGTCISQEHYEVDEKVALRFAESHKIKGEAPGKWMVDLRVANKHQLLSFGIPVSQIEVSPYCTWQHNEDFFSHRKEQGRTGRMMAVIAVSPVS